MKTFEKVFGILLLIISSLALILVALKVATESHNISDLSVLLVFCLPVLLSLLFSVRYFIFNK